MASLFERAQNLIDDHQDRQTAAAAAKQRAQTINEQRDALLGKSLDVFQEYRMELAVATSTGAAEKVHTRYAARFEGINDAFTTLRQSEPSITTRIDAEQFRREAERYSEQQTLRREYERSVMKNNFEQACGNYQTGAGSGFSF